MATPSKPLGLDQAQVLNPNEAFDAGTARFATTFNPSFIDVTPAKATVQPKIGREGFLVPQVAFNPSVIGTFVNTLTPIAPSNEPRVVSQSIPPKTKVTPNTTVDVTMTARSVIPFDVFENIHPALQGKPIETVDPILNDAAARQTLLKFDNPNDVPAAERTSLIGLMNAKGIPIDETNTSTSFGTAFQSLRSALAFG